MISNLGPGFPPRTFFLTNAFFSASSTVSPGDASHNPSIFELCIFGEPSRFRFVVSGSPEDGFRGRLAEAFEGGTPIGKIFVKAQRREEGFLLLESTSFRERH